MTDVVQIEDGEIMIRMGHHRDQTDLINRSGAGIPNFSYLNGSDIITCVRCKIWAVVVLKARKNKLEG